MHTDSVDPSVYNHRTIILNSLKGTYHDIMQNYAAYEERVVGNLGTLRGP